MRTTLTIDDDVARWLEEEERRSGRSFKEVVNQTLRLGLRRQGGGRPTRPFRTEGHDFGFKPGIDRDRMNQLADELQAEAFRDGRLAGK